jgi:siderophore synthetase component
MRTIMVRPKLEFMYHLKLSLACQITSALRTITPWSAIGAPEVSELLVKLLPKDMWVYREVASVNGGQEDFNEAKHMSCILREDLEFKARAQGEALILAAALPQPVLDCGKTHAEMLFGLDTPEQKLAWFRECVSPF